MSPGSAAPPSPRLLHRPTAPARRSRPPGSRSRRSQRFATQAPELVVLLSSPIEGHKIPVWEQELSCGAAAMNLLHAASALGFGGGWVTGWAAYSPAVLEALGGRRRSGSRGSSSSAPKAVSWKSVQGRRSRMSVSEWWQPTLTRGKARKLDCRTVLAHYSAMSEERPVYLRLRDNIAAMILEGKVGDGDALPSVRSLAAEFGANPLTVAKAYQSFQDEGLVLVRRGVGMFVAPGATDRLRKAEPRRFPQPSLARNRRPDPPPRPQRRRAAGANSGLSRLHTGVRRSP